MAAIYWTAGIIFTIWCGFALAQKVYKRYKFTIIFGSSVTFFWINWLFWLSVPVVGYPITGPLFWFQFPLTIILFIYFYDRYKKDNERDIIIKNLEKNIPSDQFYKYIKYLETIDQHRKVFFEAFNMANNSICIHSGWATDYVVDEDFKKRVCQFLSRGVNIYIDYGYKSSNFGNLLSKEYRRNKKSNENAEKIFGEIIE